MNRRAFAVVALFALSVLAASLPAHAQTPRATIISNIAFGFFVGDKPFPAGEYRIQMGEKKYDNPPHRMPALRLQSADGKLVASLEPITRLARQHMGDAPKASLVFDKVGDKHYLSEVWVADEDGFLLRGTEEEHQHDIVDVK